MPTAHWYKEATEGIRLLGKEKIVIRVWQQEGCLRIDLLTSTQPGIQLARAYLGLRDEEPKVDLDYIVSGEDMEKLISEWVENDDKLGLFQQVTIAGSVYLSAIQILMHLCTISGMLTIIHQQEEVEHAENIGILRNRLDGFLKEQDRRLAETARLFVPAGDYSSIFR